jgi:translin
MDRDRLDSIADDIRSDFNSINEARDGAFHRSRQLIALCARSIRAIHREEWPQVEELLDEARSAAQQLKAGVESYPNLYYAGYTQDALKEYVEASLVYSLISNKSIPSPSELGVESNTWLNGLAEASTELRRSILDIIRHGHSQEAERLLSIMDDIYLVLVTFDFSDAITRGLRRRTDTVRAVLERTRGDVTNSLRQAELQKALEAMENRMAVLPSERD